MSEDDLELLIRSIGGVLQLVGVAFVVFSIEGARRFLGREPLGQAVKARLRQRYERARQAGVAVATRLHHKLDRLRGRQIVVVGSGDVLLPRITAHGRGRVGWPTQVIDWSSLSPRSGT